MVYPVNCRSSNCPFLDSPSTAGCENWPLQPAAQGGEPVEPRLLSSFGGLAGMTGTRSILSFRRKPESRTLVIRILNFFRLRALCYDHLVQKNGAKLEKPGCHLLELFRFLRWIEEIQVPLPHFVRVFMKEDLFRCLSISFCPSFQSIQFFNDPMVP